MNVELVLASGSPRRREILQALGVQFSVLEPSPGAEKSLPRHLPMPRLQQLLPEVSLGKAQEVAQRSSATSLVLAADTVVYVKGQVLGKPAGALVARRYLEMLSGRAHRVLTAVSLCCNASQRSLSALESTEVRFRPLLSSEIEAYVATGEPLDKAGAYGIQGWGALLLDSIQGRYDNVVGLPLVTLEGLMQTLGYRLLDFRC